MDVTLVLVIMVVVIALLFDFTNGFHDAANAIATSVATRALTPRVALIMAAVMNLVGALLGTSVAKTIAQGIIHVPHAAKSSLVVVLAALLGAVMWNFFTWWLGLPSSSSHALIGGLCGAGLAASTQVYWLGILEKVVIPMVISPVFGFVVAFFLMKGVLNALADRPYHSTMKHFRVLQTISAAAMALGHGLQDAQKTMGVIVLALVAGGLHTGTDIPTWVKLAAAGAISLGTLTGGKRIMHTLGHRIIELDPARGFVAESIAAGVLYTTAFVWHAPISTTHTITSAIMGVGATKRRSAVRWGVAKNIVWAWIFTLPCSAAVAALSFFILHPIIT